MRRPFNVTTDTLYWEQPRFGEASFLLFDDYRVIGDLKWEEGFWSSRVTATIAGNCWTITHATVRDAESESDIAIHLRLRILEKLLEYRWQAHTMRRYCLSADRQDLALPVELLPPGRSNPDPFQERACSLVHDAGTRRYCSGSTCAARIATAPGFWRVPGRQPCI